MIKTCHFFILAVCKNLSHFFSVLEATRVNKVSVVEHLVRIPGTVSQRELDVSLAAAVKKKSAECASVLLDAGADANAKVTLTTQNKEPKGR